MTAALWRVEFPIDDELSEALAECLLEAGADAIVEEPGRVVVYGDTDRALRLEAAFLGFRDAVSLALPGLAMADSVRSPVAPDYHRAWLERLEPVQLTPGLVLCPLGKDPDPSFRGRKLSFVPQPSFGSGEHETTRLMARAIEGFFENLSEEERARTSVLDVGTGTGVLALVALASGADHVVATDIDATSIEAARENARQNGMLEKLTLVSGSLPASAEQFSLVLANIDRNTLLRLTPELASKVRGAGTLMLTGILHEDVSEVEAGYLGFGFVRKELTTGSEFSQLVLARG